MEKFWGTVPYVDHALSVNEETFLPQTKRETLFDNMLVLRQQRQGDTFMEFPYRTLPDTGPRRLLSAEKDEADGKWKHWWETK